MPPNFITKKEAEALGWEGGSLEPYAPGCASAVAVSAIMRDFCRRKREDLYGKNLDALYDCLTGLQEETKIVVRNRELLKKHLGKYAISFLQVLVQAEQECRNLCLKED